LIVSRDIQGFADGPDKAHRSLAALMRDIAEARQEIVRREAELEAFADRLQRDLAPLEKQMADVRVATLRALGRHLRDGWMRKRDRELLREILIDFADELEDAFGLDLREERTTLLGQVELTGEEAALMQAEEEAMEEEFRAWAKANFSGFDPDDGGRAEEGGGEGMGSRRSERIEEPRRRGRPRNPNSKAAMRRQAEEQAVAGDIRALYLLLARALHPDKEADPARRQEKTAWMQKVTAAYSGRDLAGLLDILARNPLDSVGPYLSQAPLKTVQGFAKRLRRELAHLKDKAARVAENLNPYFSRFLGPRGLKEPAWKGHLSILRKDLKIRKERLTFYRSREGAEELVEALRECDWRDLM
jgi:hypothetical protein